MLPSFSIGFLQLSILSIVPLLLARICPRYKKAYIIYEEILRNN
jgi:hypothetical protein